MKSSLRLAHETNHLAQRAPERGSLRRAAVDYYLTSQVWCHTYVPPHQPLLTSVCGGALPFSLTPLLPKLCERMWQVSLWLWMSSCHIRHALAALRPALQALRSELLIDSMRASLREICCNPIRRGWFDGKRGVAAHVYAAGKAYVLNTTDLTERNLACFLSVAAVCSGLHLPCSVSIFAENECPKLIITSCGLAPGHQKNEIEGDLQMKPNENSLCLPSDRIFGSNVARVSAV
jgi:hypothetical protein